MQHSSSGTFYPRIFAVVTAGLLALALFFILKPFLAAIAWALLAAFLLHPLHVRVTRKLRGRASLSSFLLTTVTLILCIGPLTGLLVAFVQQASLLLDRVQ